jgi:mRNA-degrading endonuclease toxin of MazEF toxin-antitoxin module
MARGRALRHGDVVWVDNVHPLEGGWPTRRPVVVWAFDGQNVILVGITTDRSDPSRVDLPATCDEPGTTSGLDRRCAALPHWIEVRPRRELRVEDRCGFLPEATLDHLEAAIEEVR